MKWSINQKKEIKYDIFLSEDILNPANKWMLLGNQSKNSKRFVVVDEYIYNLYYEKLKFYFEKNNIKSKIISFQSGENNKTLENYIKLSKELNNFPIDRKGEPIIAIGGGVVTDIVGYVASSYRRGIPHIKIPTTLMGYIDAAIGIKTGINFFDYKNRMGSFEPPKAVILDRTFLKTLPERHIVNGVGEMVKLAVIKDYNLFNLLENNGIECIENNFQNDVGNIILNSSIQGMLEELEPNLYEDNLERCVDFGHTFSTILEMYNIDKLLHGEAVSVDVAISVVLATVKSILSEIEQNRVIELIRKLKLPYYDQAINPNLLWESIIERTHHRDGLQRVPLPSSIGKYIFVNDITYEEVVETCGRLKKIYNKLNINCKAFQIKEKCFYVPTNYQKR